MSDMVLVEGKQIPLQENPKRYGLSRYEWLVFLGTSLASFIFMASVTKTDTDLLTSLVQVSLSLFSLLFS